ncbi:MAG: hypothetical protein OEW56_10365, partial [Gemmatimonadota bacterium]|nr:hypothetical protein [Gemmatimonadota bacterium]
AVHQALSKMPADRFTSAADFAAALENTAFTSAGTAPSAGAATSAAPPFRRSAVVITLAAVAILTTALAAWGWIGRLSQGPAPVTREQVRIGSLGTIPFQLATSTALTPDGSAIIYADTTGGTPQLWVKERDQRDPAPVPGTTGVTGGVTISPDGAWIVFTSGPQLKKIPRRGGAAITLSDSAGALWKPAWLDDGTIVFPGPGPATLYQVPSGGGVTERILSLGETGGDGFVRVAPVSGRRAVLIGGLQANFAVGNVWMLDLETREPRLLVPGASWAQYASTGHLVYALRDGSLLAAPLDLDDWTLGTAVSLEEGLRVTAGVAEAELGMDGTLLYALGTGIVAPVTPIWVDRSGNAEPVDPGFTLAGVPLNGGMRLSPDGTRLAFTAIGEAGAVSQDLFVKRLPSGPAARVTFEGTSNRRPTWSRNGVDLLFISNRSGKDAVWSQRADGVGAATLLVGGDGAIFEALWSPDGQWLVYRTDDDAGVGRGDILAIRPGKDTTPVALVATNAEETGPAISHDGRWLAYAADETGRKEIYVRPFPNTEDGKWLVSTGGGTEPAWARSGRELFFRDGAGNLVAATFTVAGNTFEVQQRQVLFGAQSYWGNDDHRWYDVAPDDRRFIMIDPGFGAGTADLVKVGNLHSVLRGR